jgi:hypothetical protein
MKLSSTTCRLVPFRPYSPVTVHKAFKGNMPAHIFHPSLDGLKSLVLAVLFLLAVDPSSAQTPKDNFCRRFAHQTTVIDDKLYIDGG